MLSEVTIANFAPIEKPLRLPFGRTTLILGPPVTGKTAICDAISCLFEYKAVFSKAPGRISSNPSILQAKAVDLKGAEALIEREIQISDNKAFADHLRVNESETSDFSSLSSILKVFYIDDRTSMRIRSGRDVAKFCLLHLAGWSGGLAKQHFLSLGPFAKAFNSYYDRMVEAIKWLPTGRMQIKNWHQDFWLPFESLSSSEQWVLVSDLSLVLGHLSSRYRPVLVIFDGLLEHLDKGNRTRMARRIDSITNPNLQFLLTGYDEELEELDALFLPDCSIRLSTDLRGSIKTDVKKRTPKGILDIEQRIKSYKGGNEDEFINSVVMPLLFAMGFSLVSRVTHHGPGELGLDIGPFVGLGFEWRNAFCGAQAKSVKLNAKSGHRNNITVLIHQVEKALHNRFFDMTSAVESELDYLLVFLSQYPTKEALSTFHSAFVGQRKVIVLDPLRIAELAWRHGAAIC